MTEENGPAPTAAPDPVTLLDTRIDEPSMMGAVAESYGAGGRDG